MDLKDVVEKVKYDAEEAYSAFHAGHQVVAKRFLNEITVLIKKYFDEMGMPESDVTESATSEKPAATSQETPAAPGGPAAQAGAVLPAADAQKKALDQAGP